MAHEVGQVSCSDCAIHESATEPAYVCDLTPAFELSGPTISYHLKVLREAGLVDAERRATWVYCRPRRGVLNQLAALLSIDAPAPVA